MINKLLLFFFSLLVLAGLFAPLMAPHDAQFYYERGLQILSTTDPDRQWAYRWDLNSAGADFSHAIRLNPDFIAAYTNRAGIELIRGELDAALKDYSAAIDLNPQDPNNYLSRAQIKVAQSDFAGALDNFGKVVALQPDNWPAYRGRIQVMENQGDFTGAVMERVRMVEESIPPLSVTTNNDFFARNLDRWRERFVRQLDRALQSDTNFAWGFYYRGVIKSLADDWTGAMTDYQRCQRLPDNTVKDYAAIQTWLVQTQSGEREKAAQQLFAYCESRTNGTPADWQMCIAKYLLNQTSAKDFHQAIDSADAGKEQSEYWYYTGMKCLLADDKAGANDCFKKSLTTKTRPCAVYFSARAELSALNPAP